jgi:hypothetical protein
VAAGDLTTLANVKQWLDVTGLSISAITNAATAVVTLQTRPQTPLVSGFAYTIEGATGMALPDGEYTVTVLSPTTFSIPFDSTLAGTYTGNATVGISDPLLARLITAASTAVQSWLNRTIAQTTYTEQRDGYGQPQMMFMNYPVSSVAYVSINGNAIQAAPPLGPTTVSGNFGGYVYDSNRLMLRGLTFPVGFQNVQIQYTAGYATTPADIEQATIDIIGDWFKYRGRIGLSSMGIEGQSISLTAFTNRMMPVRAQLVLDQYRRVAPIV